LDDSIKKSEEERLLFNKFLEESNNLIQELLNEMSPKPKEQYMSIETDSK
jgi:hypothetical protein